jgi:class 3 adenylate cyclase
MCSGGTACPSESSGVKAEDHSFADIAPVSSNLRPRMAHPSMTEKRKLAAILAADVVGFSRLTGSDEEGTLARLRTLWSDLIAPTIAVHNGRVVKRTGDGSIIEFRSVVD